MIEAHIVNSNNRHLYREEWEQFLHLRHDHFVDEKKWREPSADGRETDQFGTDAATYLIGMEDGNVVPSARIIRSTDPTMVSEVFPGFCDVRPVPTEPEVAEWTRSFVARGKRSYGLRGTAGQMAGAVMEYCLGEGIRYVGGIQPLYFLPRWQDIGWNAVPFGAPQKAGGEWCIVAYIEVSSEALASVRDYCGIDAPLVRRRSDKVDRRLPPRINRYDRNLRTM